MTDLSLVDARHILIGLPGSPHLMEIHEVSSQIVNLNLGVMPSRPGACRNDARA
jgi:hypothetical protein